MRVIRPVLLFCAGDLCLGIGRRRRWVGAVGAGLGPAPTLWERAMSRRQRERTSLFRGAIETGVRSAAVELHDNDVEASASTAIQLWWTSRLRGRRFVQLVRQARDVTRQRISLGVVQLGEPGRREAMPYFFAVLRNLVDQERSAPGHRSDARRVE
jgi:hypothetical protein